MTDKQKRIRDFIAKNPYCTVKDISVAMMMSINAVRCQLTNLKKLESRLVKQRDLSPCKRLTYKYYIDEGAQ